MFENVINAIILFLSDAHRRYGGMGTMLVIKVGTCTAAELCAISLSNAQGSTLGFLIFWLPVQVSAESANQFGELVADPITKELLHYTEKPETFVR